MLEAECTRCGETFIPASTQGDDLIHGPRYDEVVCGGIGIITGKWIIGDKEALELTDEKLTAMEQHGVDNPDCADPYCKFHHPEESK
jgi:hypothetical protein